MIIDTKFNFYSDAKGSDPDSSSPTLRRYHKILWSKPLPNGKTFELTDSKSGVYLGDTSPLYETLLRYRHFFDLFENFVGYIHFFLLEDLIDENLKIKFYRPFDDFKTSPTFSDIDEYLVYKKGVMNFIMSRNRKIENYT